MSSLEARNISVVLKYFDGCNSGDLDDLLSTLDPGVVHYFLPQRFKPIQALSTSQSTGENSSSC